jgi:hypothetical protein
MNLTRDFSKLTGPRLKLPALDGGDVTGWNGSSRPMLCIGETPDFRKRVRKTHPPRQCEWQPPFWIRAAENRDAGSPEASAFHLKK